VFIGAINSGVRQFLASMAPTIDGHDCVIGCSGNFTSETVLSLFSKPTAIYSNDVSLYSCLAGAYLTGEDFPMSISDERLGWLEPWMGSDLSKLAAIMVLIDMLPFEKQDNAYKKRMWKIYLENFGVLVEKTEARISNVATRITGYYGGDVFRPFQAA
jgi:hypothetical protein